MAIADIGFKIDFRTFNKCFMPFISCDIPTQILYGGAASGKSTFAVHRAVLDVIGKGRNYLCIRNVANTLRSSLFNEFISAIEDYKMRPLFNIAQSDMSITCLCNSRQILFRGLDDPEKLKSIKPIRGVITDLLIEEATEMAEPAFNQLDLRLRGGDPNIIKRKTLLFNPINKQHWIYRRFFSKIPFNGRLYRDDEIVIFKSTHLDNKFLTKQDHANIERYKDIDKYYYDVYALGEWGILGNLIFNNWEVRDLSESRFGNYRNGLDFGFTNDPTALWRGALEHSDVYVLQEMYERGLTNDMIAARILPIIGKEIITCDSSEPKSVSELQRLGISAIGAKKGKDSVDHGIQWLKQRKIIVDKRNQNMINELGTYHWAQDRDGNVLNIPVGINDHLISAMRYGLENDMLAMGTQIW